MQNIIILIVLVVAGVFFFRHSNSNILATDVPTKSKFSYSGKDVFTYDELRAESPKDIENDKGETNQNDFLTAFNHFPWKEQIEISNNLKVQSPTLSIHDQLLKQTLFISMSGSKENGVGYILGITKSRDGSDADIGTIVRTQNTNGVISLIQNFFARNTDIESQLKSTK